MGSLSDRGRKPGFFSGSLGAGLGVLAKLFQRNATSRTAQHGSDSMVCEPK